MATVPCTLIVQTKDIIDLPLKMLYVVYKQLFRYEMRSLQMKRTDQVRIRLSCSPKGETVMKKFDNLLLKYIRNRPTSWLKRLYRTYTRIYEYVLYVYYSRTVF